jgi:hypothetical protein
LKTNETGFFGKNNNNVQSETEAFYRTSFHAQTLWTRVGIFICRLSNFGLDNRNLDGQD